MGCKAEEIETEVPTFQNSRLSIKKELLVTAVQGTCPKRRNSNTESRACTFVTHVPISSGSRSLTATSLPGLLLGQGRPPVLHFYARLIFLSYLKAPFTPLLITNIIVV